MSDTAIKVERLSKRYRIGLKEEKHDTFGGAVFSLLKSPFSNLRKLRKLTTFEDNPSKEPNSRLQAPSSTPHAPCPMPSSQSNDIIWALRDVSFEVKQGEVVGIIGRNGAGKTTLLKIISRITEPTSGRVRFNGRVSSLLEVGTGFHSELTGRENVYLNGTILGMSKSEVDRKFDEIVAFSEIEKFIDTPVKRYSSGMTVRLAFAVAAHLEPEILLVDEVLAVGDITFQKKCMGKMGDVSKEGRTVLFVSHNMTAITRLCPRAIMLHEGALTEDGNSGAVVSHYMKSDSGTMGAQEWTDIKKAPGDRTVRLLAVRVRNHDGQICETVDIRQPITIEMQYDVLISGSVLRPWFIFWNDEGVCLFSTADTNTEHVEIPRPKGIYTSLVIIPNNFFAEGGITVAAGMATAGSLGNHFSENPAVAFQVVDTLDGDSARGKYGGPFAGVVRPKLNWTTKKYV